MKAKLPYIAAFQCAFLAFCGAFAQTTTNLYTDSTYDPAISLKPIELSLNSNWHVDSESGAVFTGSVTQTAENINNLYALATISDNGKQSFALSSNLTVNDFTFDIIAARITNPDTGTTVSAGYYHRTDLGTNTLTVLGNFSLINNSDTAVWNPKLEFQNSAIDIGGNLSIKNNSSASGMYIPTFSSKMTVNGDMLFSGSRTSQAYLGGTSTTIKGVVDFGSITSNSLDFAYIATTATRNIGGFKGTGKLQMRTEGNVTLSLTNSDNQTFSGTFAMASKTAPEGMLASTLSIVMDATDAAKGRQTFRFQKLSASYNSYDNNYYNANLGDVTVKNGTLAMGMYEGMSAKSLSINGDKAIFSAASATSVASTSPDIGTAYFQSISLAKGSILVDISETAADKIVSTGAINLADGANIADVSININVSSADLREWLGAAEVDYIDYTIMTFASTNLTVSDFESIIKTNGGVDFEVLSTDFAKNQLTIRLSVPEPATIAAILGAIALAFAAYRRRK